MLPGAVDLHTHLALPFGGTVSADDYASGTRSAVCGGTTTVFDYATPDNPDEPLAEFAGAGATVPLLGFGHLLAQGVLDAVAERGLLGALTGGFTAAAAGITASLTTGFLLSVISKSRDQS